MRIVRFSAADERPRWGVLEGDVVRELDGAPFDGMRPTDRCLPPERFRLLAPVAPTKIVCLGLNYRDHAREMGDAVPPEPLLFLKPPSAVIGPGDAIVLPPGAGRVDYEAELALVIGRRSRNLSREEALGSLLGITCLDDVTARDLQKSDGQWTRAKGFDTFCPLGPWIETGWRGEPLEVECLVNGVSRQRGTTADLVHDAASILAFVSGIMTLEPGDVIATGTPPGIGPLAPGDAVEVRVGGVGSLVNPVRAAR